MSDLSLYQPLKNWLAKDSMAPEKKSPDLSVRDKRSSPYYRGLTDQSLLQKDRKGGYERLCNLKGAMSQGTQGLCCLKGAMSPETKDKPATTIVTSLTNPNEVGLSTQRDVHKKQNPNKDFIWADKYRPKTLDDFIYHRDLAVELLRKVRYGSYSHLVFEGCPGSGKRSMVLALLRELYGHDKLETRRECRGFNLEVGGEAISSIQVNVKVSCEHVQVDVSDIDEDYAAQVVVQLNDSISHSVIVVDKAETLTKSGQLHIRSFLEGYKGNNKLIFCCSCSLKLQHLRSLCQTVQFFPPSTHETVQVLNFIAHKEGVELPHKMAETIARNSHCSLRQAIRSFEATFRLNYPLMEDQTILTGWEEEIANIAKRTIKEQSSTQLYLIREKLQILNEHHVCPEFIFRMLGLELQKQADDRFLLQISGLCHQYSATLNRRNSFDGNYYGMDKRVTDGTVQNVVQGRRYLVLEEFVAKFMSIYKSLLYNRQARRRVRFASP